MATVSELDGRKWSDTASGGTVERRFQITGLAVGHAPSFSYTGLPNVGDAHPSLANFVCTSRDFQEGNGSEKQRVIVTVKYEPRTLETSGSGETAVTCVVDEWGWDDGTDEKELTSDVDGVQVLNSAGDPFDSVPKVSAPAPVFTKVMKFAARQSGWTNANCKVNDSAVTIGSMSCPVGTLLCTVSEKRLIGNADYKYQYVVRLRYKSNPVKIAGDSTTTDIGWDVAVADAGMRELVTTGSGDDASTEKKLIRVIDKETGKLCTVTSPALLNGSGAKLADNASPYNFRFKAYARASFPNWFYSEPTAVEEGL